MEDNLFGEVVGSASENPVTLTPGAGTTTKFIKITKKPMANPSIYLCIAEIVLIGL